MIVFTLFSVLYGCDFNESQTPFLNWELSVSFEKRQIEFTYINDDVGVESIVALLEVEDSVIFSDTIYSISESIFVPFKGGTDRTINEIDFYLNMKDSTVLKEFNIAFESPEFLKSEYNFTNVNGYLVIERCEFELVQASDKYPVASLNLPFKRYNSIKTANRIESDLLDYNSESLYILGQENANELIILEKAIFLTQYIWSKFGRTGPSDIISYNESTYEILEKINNAGGTVQCSGTRDLFTSLSDLTNSGLVIRNVEAHRYYPFIKNIIPNGHSILELRTGEGWVLFDPFVRVYFEHLDTGKLLSASEIKELFLAKSLEKIRPIHINTSHGRREDFESINNPYDHNEYNYFTHFNHLKYYEIE